MPKKAKEGPNRIQQGPATKSRAVGRLARIAKTGVFVDARASLPFRGDAMKVITQMRNGTPARQVADVAEHIGLSQDRLFAVLGLPKSTVKGRISAGGKLSAVEQDRMYRAEKVLLRAVQVLEDEDAARAWLQRVNRSLGGAMPLELLDTEPGYELVLDTLGRIEYGVAA